MISKVYGHIATATCLAFSLFMVGCQLPKSKMLNNYSSKCSYNGEDISYSLADKKFEVSKNGKKIVSYGTGEQFSFSNGGYGLNCNAVAVGVKAVVDGVAAGAAAGSIGAGAAAAGASAAGAANAIGGAAVVTGAAVTSLPGAAAVGATLGGAGEVAAAAAATEAAVGAGALIGGALATFGIGLLAGAALG